MAKDLAFGARAARTLLATPPPPFLGSSRLAETGAQLGSSVEFWLGLLASASGGAAQSNSAFVINKNITTDT